VSDALPPARRRFLTGSGETPAHDDDGADAVAYRARLGAEAHVAVAQLKASVDGLNTRIDEWGETWSGRWATVATIFKVLIVPVAVAASLGLARLVWGFVSTLHH
jgi:hypothetical protein